MYVNFHWGEWQFFTLKELHIYVKLSDLHPRRTMSINRESLNPVLFFPPVKTFPCPHYLPRRWATSHKADSMNTATDCPGRPVDKPYFKDHCSLSIFFLILNNPTPTNNCHVKFTADLLPIFPLLIHENPVPSCCNRYSPNYGLIGYPEYRFPSESRIRVQTLAIPASLARLVPKSRIQLLFPESRTAYFYLACVASVSVRFRGKVRETRVKDRAKNEVFFCSETKRKRLLRRLILIPQILFQALFTWFNPWSQRVACDARTPAYSRKYSGSDYNV